MPVPSPSINRCVACLAMLCVLIIGVRAEGALFDHPGIPAHSGHVAWDDGVPTFHHHHFHKTDAGGDAVAGHDVGHQLSGNAHYDAYSVWVNETYHVHDGPNDDTAFSHGYIIEDLHNMPEYRFQGDAACNLFDNTGAVFDARASITAAFNAWSNITNDDPVHTSMGLQFRQYNPADGDAAEITVKCVDHIAGAVARWQPGTRTLEFRRYTDVAATTKHQWYLGNQAGVPNSNLVDDFLTVAMHETGHVVGLDHQNDSDDIMHVLAGRGDIINNGGTFRTLSGDDILGARDLYTIPEPMTISLLALGGLFLRRRRS